MADNTKKTVHPRMAEAIANAEKAAVSNRGMYPHTKAGNVYQSDGEPLEAPAATEEEGGGDEEEAEAGCPKDCENCEKCTEECAHPECDTCEECPDHDTCSNEECKACKAE